MATVTFGNGDVDFSSFGFPASQSPSTLTSSFIELTVPDTSKIDIFGSFTIASGGISGTITQLTTYEPSGSLSVVGPLLFSVSGINVPVSTFLAYDQANNIAGLESYVFSGNDTWYGGTGNDVFIETGGSDTIVGGSGLNEYKASSPQSSYVITRTGENAFTIAKPEGGTDTVTGVARILFSDGSALAMDVNGTAGQIYLLYQGALDRAPDLPGLGYWIYQADQGASLVTIAGDFVGSSEFTQLYGSTTNTTTFVTNLYENLLHRAPDAAGLAYWVGTGETPAQLLAAFAESTENQANFIGVIGNGIHYTPWVTTS